MPDCSGWVTESHTTALGSLEKKEVLRSPPCPSFPVSVFLSFVPSIYRCFALARCHTFFFSLRLMGPLGNVVSVHSSARVITLSLSLCPSPALSHTSTAKMKMLTEQPGSSWLQASAGSASEEEKTQRETHRNSPVTNYFISTNIPCSLLINMRSEKLHVE